MTVLITGSNGFLGKSIKYFLIKSNNVFDLPKIRLEKNIPALSQSFNIVVHVAGKAHFKPKTLVEKAQFYKVNVLGTQNLLKGLVLAGVPEQFVFISSVAVYGIDKGVNISENEILMSEDLFGISKIKAEEIVAKWCEEHNVICTILRLPLVVGANPPGNLGAMIKGIQKGYYFNIGGGTAKKSMVLASDVGKYILKAAEVGGIYNLTDGYHPTFAEISNNISFQLGKKNQ